jgi:ribosomal protein S18 acetylase RimI-like enzyme
LADDELGYRRETPILNDIAAGYRVAFEEICLDPNQALMVVEEDGKILGTCHLTYMPSLTFQGAKRMNIEAVRIDRSSRNRGIGEWMIRKAIEIAKSKKCKIVQLATNKKRADAKRFYEKLGFEASHEGMKLYLALDGESGQL